MVSDEPHFELSSLVSTHIEVLNGHFRNIWTAQQTPFLGKGGRIDLGRSKTADTLKEHHLFVLR